MNFILLLLVATFSTSSAFPPEWASCIVQACTEFPNHPQCMLIHSPPTVGDPLTPLSYLVPPVLLWSPQEQFIATSFSCPACTTPSNSHLFPSGWRDGTSERLIPRRIHGIHSTVLLVTRMYKCQRGHEVLGYDPGVLSQVPSHGMIPFRLWHKTGATRELIEWVHSLVATGTAFNVASTMLLHARYREYVRRVNILEALPGTVEMSFPTFEQWCSYFPSDSPSRHFLSACFLLSFWDKEPLYNKHMRSLSIHGSETWLSCDHTFASAGRC